MGLWAAIVVLVVLAAGVVAAGAARAAAQATPAAESPPVPVPATECRVTPRDEAPDDLARDGTAPPGLLPTPPDRAGGIVMPDEPVRLADLPRGVPTDARTVASVRATLRHLAARRNATRGGDDPVVSNRRQEALYSDDVFRRSVVVQTVSTPEPAEDLRDVVEQVVGIQATVSHSSYSLFGLPPEASAPAAERVRLLPDGRAIAVVLSEGSAASVVVFVEDPETRRHLIDEFAVLAEDAATPVPWQPANDGSGASSLSIR